MAQYTEDFSAHTTGTQPATWSTFAAVSGTTYLVQDDGAAIGGKKLVITRANSNENQGLGFDTLNADPQRADVEVLCKFKTTAGDSDIAAPALRWVSNSEKYLFQMYGGTATARRIRTGTGSNFAGALTPDSVDRWVWFRASAQGNDLKLRYWFDGDQEPSTWDIEVTDTHTSGPGLVGLETWTGGPYEIDFFSAGTGGDSAPNPGAQTGATLTINEATVSPGGQVTWVTSLTGVQRAYVTDSYGNVFALTDVTDTSGNLPALSHGQNACMFENGVTVTVTTVA